MTNHKWSLACLALAAGVLIAGCGSSGGGTATVTTTAAGGTGTTTTSTEASGQATPDAVYQACLNAVKGTAAESAGQNACANARDAFEQCTTQASNAPAGTARDTALKACQAAANKTVAALKSSP